MTDFRGPKLTVDLYSLYILASNASMILDSGKQEEVMKSFGHVLQEKFGISKKDIRQIEEKFDIEASDDEDEDDEEEHTKDLCCVCSNELFFGAEATNCAGECTECHQEICESRTCVKLSEEDALYCLTCWMIKEEDGEPEYGNCGFRCDGHCQTCDPGYPHGGYDGADEI
jgi:hypothetical protein